MPSFFSRFPLFFYILFLLFLLTLHVFVIAGWQVAAGITRVAV